MCTYTYFIACMYSRLEWQDLFFYREALLDKRLLGCMGAYTESRAESDNALRSGHAKLHL